MEQILDIIKRRASIRAYLDKPLPEDIVNSIMEAARYTPTARNMQELEYKVITNKALIQKASDTIAAAMTAQGRPVQPRHKPSFFYGAPLLIIIAGPRDNYWVNTDAALAVQSIMLYATSLNLGSCFIGMARLIENDPKMIEELHIAADMRIAAAVICGYPNEKPAPVEKNLNVEFFPEGEE